MSTHLSILITGSNQGLGFEAAKHLSKHSHVHLFISGRNAGRVQEALEKLKAEEGCSAKLDSVILDVSNDDSINAAVKEVEGKLSSAGLNVLINNSGVSLDMLKEPLRKRFEDTYAVNVFGAAVTAEAFLPLLKKSGENSRILNISSGLGSIGWMASPDGPYKGVQLLVYNSSKSALNAITTTLAMTHGIHSVAIDPGYNATNLNGYSGPMAPSEGAKIIVEHALKKTGKSPGYYSKDGEVPW